MRNDFEQLLWLYSMGVEQVATRQPIDYSESQIVKKIKDSSNQDIPVLKKTQKIRGTESEKSIREAFEKKINEMQNINSLTQYWRNILINEFNLKKFWGLNELDESKKCNILIIHEPPTRSDFARYSLLDGKKRNLINNIVFSILSGENQEEVQNIFVPILPIPLNNVAEFGNLQSFQVMFLLSLKRIIKPVLVLLVGDRASSIITTMLERDDQEILKENNYFSIPELQYMISVPEVKKTVWEEWQQKRRIINNDLFL